MNGKFKRTIVETFSGSLKAVTEMKNLLVGNAINANEHSGSANP